MGREMTNVNVADIAAGKLDGTGVKITTVYALNPTLYAVYRTAERVAIQYADASQTAQAQRASLAPLNPVRGDINGLIDGWRASQRGAGQGRAARFDRRVADALIVALEGDVAGAQALLNEIKADLLAERTSIAQFYYLEIAMVVVVVDILLDLILGGRPIGSLTDGVQTKSLWLASGAGAVGAFFSISNGIRSRTVLTDLDMLSNGLDAGLRVIIGVIAAPLLICLLASGVASIKLGAASLGPQSMVGAGYNWMLVLVVGFLAGFSERLIPDLLAKASDAISGKSPAAAAAATPPPKPGQQAPAAPSVKDQDDACLATSGVTAAVAISDADLPAASGGVAPH